MASKLQIIMTDDLDPAQFADNTVKFGLDGQALEIDLTRDHEAQLREVFARYIPHARKVKASAAPARKVVKPATPGKASEPSAPQGDPPNSVIRIWLREQGHVVSEYGPIPAGAITAWRSAHNR